MELQFDRQTVSALDTGLREVRNMEQTQEIRLTDGMPDVGRVLAAWGQPVVRSKEWRGDEIALSAGLMVWVLYAPEDGTGPRCVEGWMPFQLRWELPDRTPEGSFRVRCLTRFVDARSTSARKILIRAGLAALAEALVPMEAAVQLPGDRPEGLELLEGHYPVRLQKEAGEKTFLIDEDLTLPDSVPQPEKLVYCSLEPEITEQKVLANKVVFRGSANLHLLYLSEEGQLHSWDFPLAFSQFADLDVGYSGEAQADTWLCVTNLETDLDDEGHLRLKCGLTGQYLVEDRVVLRVVEDAYSPGRTLEVEREQLELPAVLETRRETLRSEQSIPVDANLAADIRFLPDFPRQRTTEDGVSLEIPGSYQVLYYGEDGALQSANARWEGRLDLMADENSRVSALPLPPSEPQLALGSGSMTVRAELPMQLVTRGQTRIPMVTALRPGEAVEPDPNRPSLILRRAGDDRLWDIAKASGSTMDAIRKANGLQEEPRQDQLLLIPVS